MSISRASLTSETTLGAASVRAGARARRALIVGLLAGLVALAVVAPLSSAAVGHTERVSVGSRGEQADRGVYGGSGAPAISADGRFVAFQSRASNLVAGDTNGVEDVFVRDRRSGTTERVSLGPGGVESDSFSRGPAISADGRFVAFWSRASNLVAGGTNPYLGVYVRDRWRGTTELIGRGHQDPAISADGRFVAFAAGGVFVRDRWSGSTELVSVAPDGAGPTGAGLAPAISGDGRFVAFLMWASRLRGNASDAWGMFVRDRRSGSTEQVSMGRVEPYNPFFGPVIKPAISADGRFVAFVNASYLLVYDRDRGVTERVSVRAGAPAISAGGRFVAFRSAASDLVAGDTNNIGDVFVRDRQDGSTERVSVGFDGAQEIGIGDRRGAVAISAGGRFVAFASGASNLVAGDTNNAVDVFVRDRASDGCTITGGPGDDVLVGTAGDDVICGLGGNDRLRGGDGHDVLRGGDGDDRLSGGAGRDGLAGDAGSDHLSGGSGADALAGGPGVDRASYWGRDTAVAATIGDGPNDGAANERDDIRGDVEQLAGGRGNDTLTGNAAANRLSGNAGNDRLIGGGGRDQLVGGDNDDSLDSADDARDSVDCGTGLDSVLHDALDWLSTTCENG